MIKRPRGKNSRNAASIQAPATDASRTNRSVSLWERSRRAECRDLIWITRHSRLAAKVRSNVLSPMC